MYNFIGIFLLSFFKQFFVNRVVYGATDHADCADYNARNHADCAAADDLHHKAHTRAENQRRYNAAGVSE